MLILDDLFKSESRRAILQCLQKQYKCAQCSYLTISAETVTLAEALQRSVLDPTTAIFHDPRTKVVFSIDKAIAHGLIDETGHHTHYRTKDSMTLQVCYYQYLHLNHCLEIFDKGIF